MKIIGPEEHYWMQELAEALTQLPPEQQDDTMKSKSEKRNQLLDLGETRLRDMDVMGLDMMVLSLSSPATQILPPQKAVALSRQANNQLSAAIKAHPDRFAGFATLLTSDPKAAAEELQRCIEELHFCGALINGRTGKRYLDHQDYLPLLEMAEKLQVPIYIHPQIAPRPVREWYYDGFDSQLNVAFADGG